MLELDTVLVEYYSRTLHAFRRVTCSNKSAVEEDAQVKSHCERGIPRRGMGRQTSESG
jgi:hypothetical protein